MEDDGNIIEAIKLLKKSKSICKSSKLICNNLVKYEEIYRSQIIEVAEIIYNNEGYESAINVLTEGLSVLEYDHELLEKRVNMRLLHYILVEG